jgi:hypothetical protein
MFARPPSLPSCLHPAVSPSKNRGDRYAVMTSAEEFESGATGRGKMDGIALSCGVLPPKYSSVLRHDIVMIIIMIVMDLLTLPSVVLGLCPRSCRIAALPFRFGGSPHGRVSVCEARQKALRVIRHTTCAERAERFEIRATSRDKTGTLLPQYYIAPPKYISILRNNIMMRIP